MLNMKDSHVVRIFIDLGKVLLFKLIILYNNKQGLDHTPTHPDVFGSLICSFHNLETFT